MLVASAHHTARAHHGRGICTARRDFPARAVHRVARRRAAAAGAEEPARRLARVPAAGRRVRGGDSGGRCVRAPAARRDGESGGAGERLPAGGRAGAGWRHRHVPARPFRRAVQLGLRAGHRVVPARASGGPRAGRGRETREHVQHDPARHPAAQGVRRLRAQLRARGVRRAVARVRRLRARLRQRHARRRARRARVRARGARGPERQPGVRDTHRRVGRHLRVHRLRRTTAESAQPRALDAERRTTPAAHQNVRRDGRRREAIDSLRLPILSRRADVCLQLGAQLREACRHPRRVGETQCCRVPHFRHRYDCSREMDMTPAHFYLIFACVAHYIDSGDAYHRRQVVTRPPVTSASSHAPRA